MVRGATFTVLESGVSPAAEPVMIAVPGVVRVVIGADAVVLPWGTTTFAGTVATFLIQTQETRQKK